MHTRDSPKSATDFRLPRQKPSSRLACHFRPDKALSWVLTGAALSRLASNLTASTPSKEGVYEVV
jgi:hypothetical protein